MEKKIYANPELEVKHADDVIVTSFTDGPGIEMSDDDPASVPSIPGAVY